LDMLTHYVRRAYDQDMLKETFRRLLRVLLMSVSIMTAAHPSRADPIQVRWLDLLQQSQGYRPHQNFQAILSNALF
jgi:hypothetical protein